MAHHYHFPLLVPHRLGRVGGGFFLRNNEKGGIVKTGLVEPDPLKENA
jgi:hypothetical protein